MQIVNDCVKEGTLLLEVNGQCMSVSDAMIKYDNFMKYSIELIKSIDIKYGRCCEIANSKITKLEDKILSLEKQLIRCCKGRNIIHINYTPIKIPTRDIISIGISLGGGSIYELPYNFRSIKKRLEQNKNILPNIQKNKNYYSDKQKEGLYALSARINKNKI